MRRFMLLTKRTTLVQVLKAFNDVRASCNDEGYIMGALRFAYNDNRLLTLYHDQYGFHAMFVYKDIGGM